MPLHALRQTAAASWLNSGHSLARQLGHRSITTTEQHYSHLEQPVADVLLADRADRNVGEVGEEALTAVRLEVSRSPR